MLSHEAFESHVKAGEITAQVQALARQRAKPGVKLLELAQEIESKISESGGEIAFPANLSVNNEAAHYTPSFDDEKIIGEKDLLKIDIGVHIEGYICDAAFTIDFSGENGKLVEAVNAALSAAVSAAKPGVNVRELGKAIQHEISSRGLKPVSNLCGHAVKQYHLHAGTSIPNIEAGNYVLREGDTFAIEPFATNGYGEIMEGEDTEIFMLTKQGANARMPASRQVIAKIEEFYAELPFAKRWLHPALPSLSPLSINFAFRELVNLGVLETYPVLIEKARGLVSQAETTIIVTKDGCTPIAPIPVVV